MSHGFVIVRMENQLSKVTKQRKAQLTCEIGLCLSALYLAVQPVAKHQREAALDDLHTPMRRFMSVPIPQHSGLQRIAVTARSVTDKTRDLHGARVCPEP